MAFSTVVAFNRFQERGFIHIVAFHRLALVRRGNNLGGISQYDHYCYFGIISMDSLMANTQAEGEEGEIPPPTAGASTSEVPPANGEAGEFKPFIVDDTTSRQMQINTAELGFFPVDYFTERSSVIYQPFTYSVFANPLNKEHCSIHCAFDTDYKCDFWFIHHSHCYLGSFNQEGGIGVQNSHETITAYIFKGIGFYWILIFFFFPSTKPFIFLWRSILRAPS